MELFVQVLALFFVRLTYSAEHPVRRGKTSLHRGGSLKTPKLLVCWKLICVLDFFSAFYKVSADVRFLPSHSPPPLPRPVMQCDLWH
jgi:hypothetical protein